MRTGAAKPRDAAAFEEAYAAAQKARGWTRVVHVPLRVGERVWVLPSEAAPLVSQEDPRVWTRGRGVMVLGFVALHLAFSVACTIVTFWPPMYDLVSKVGAVVSFVYFMQVQDFTRIIRERVRSPSRAFLRGVWTRASA